MLKFISISNERDYEEGLLQELNFNKGTLVIYNVLYNTLIKHFIFNNTFPVQNPIIFLNS